MTELTRTNAFKDPAFPERYRQYADWARGPTADRAPARGIFRQMLWHVYATVAKPDGERIRPETHTPYDLLGLIGGALQVMPDNEQLYQIAASYPASAEERAGDPDGHWWFREVHQTLVSIPVTHELLKAVDRERAAVVQSTASFFLQQWGLDPDEKMAALILGTKVAPKSGFLRFAGKGSPAIFVSDHAPEVYAELLVGAWTLMGRKEGNALVPSPEGIQILGRATGRARVLLDALTNVVESVRYAREEMRDADAEEAARHARRLHALREGNSGNPDSFLDPAFDLSKPRKNPQVDDDADLVAAIVSPRGLPGHVAPMAFGMNLDTLDAAYRRDLTIAKALAPGYDSAGYPMPSVEGLDGPEPLAQVQTTLSPVHGTAGLSVALDGLQDATGLDQEAVIRRLTPVLEKAMAALPAPPWGRDRAEAIHANANTLYKATVDAIPELAERQFLLEAMFRSMLRTAYDREASFRAPSAVIAHTVAAPVSSSAPTEPPPAPAPATKSNGVRVRELRVALGMGAKEFLDAMTRHPVVLSDPTEYGSAVLEWETNCAKVTDLEFLVLAAGFRLNPNDLADYLEGDLGLSDLIARRIRSA